MAERYAKLAPNWIMRGWVNSPLALVDRATGNLCEFKDPDAVYATKALDGKTNFASFAYLPKHRALIDALLAAGTALECEKDDTLEPIQEFRAAKSPCLLEMHWAITGNCNMNCKHCFMEAPLKRYGEPTWEQIENVVDQLVSANVVYVSLTGGEPLLRPDFKDIVKLLTNKGLYINTIVTNGTALDKDMIEFLRGQDQLHEFQISLDGAGMHDKVRGTKGQEEKVCEAIRLAVEAGCKVTVDTIFDRSNRDSALETYEKMKELNPAIWLVSRSQSMGMWDAAHNEDALSTDEMGELCLEIMHRWLNDAKPFPIMLEQFYVAESARNPCHRARAEGFSADSPECPTTKIKIFLMPDGTLMPCTGFTGSAIQSEMPNIFKEGLEQSWLDSPLRRFVDTTKKHRMEAIKQCRSCEYLAACGAGCRSYALTEAKTMDAPDPFACARFKAGWNARFAELERSHDKENH